MTTQEQRIATRDRLILQLGVDRIGVGPDAPPLPHRNGTASAFAVSAETLGYQLHEYADVWSRPALGLKTRSLISVAALAAIGHGDPLYRHINIALNLGISVEQLHDALLHVSCYGGFANWEHAVGVLNEVLAARGMASEIARAYAPRTTMTTEERDALARRMTMELGVGQIGSGADARPLKPLPGGAEGGGSTGPLGVELGWIFGAYGYADVWGRPSLSPREHSFLTMAVLQAMVENHQLLLHVAVALNIGISRDDIQEAMVQAGVYHGVSGWNNAIGVARYVFEQQPASGQD